jgi:hypothetical protein
MKSRAGFVSNSSTSSFIIKVDPYVTDCLKVVGRIDYPTAWDAAMSIVNIDSCYETDDIMKLILAQFENIRQELKYIYIDRLRGCEFLEVPSGNVYVEIDNCINADWEYIKNKPHKEIKYCDHFSSEMEENYPTDYELYMKIEKSYPDPNELFERDYRHIDTNKMMEYGKSLIILKDGRSLLIEKGMKPVWKSLLDMTEKS